MEFGGTNLGQCSAARKITVARNNSDGSGASRVGLHILVTVLTVIKRKEPVEFTVAATLLQYCLTR